MSLTKNTFLTIYCFASSSDNVLIKTSIVGVLISVLSKTRKEKDQFCLFADRNDKQQDGQMFKHRCVGSKFNLSSAAYSNNYANYSYCSARS